MIPGRLETKANPLILTFHFLILIQLFYMATVHILSSSNTVFNQKRRRIKNMSRNKSGDTQVKFPSSIYISYHRFCHIDSTIRCLFIENPNQILRQSKDLNT